MLFAAPAHAQFKYRYHPGHDPNWASPTFDDSHWRDTTFTGIAETGPIWARRTITIDPGDRVPGHPFGLYVAGMFSHEVYWDGELIGRGGVVGMTADEEVPGPIESHYQVPDHLLTLGDHTLAIRGSAFHRGFTPMHGYWVVFGADYDAIVKSRTHSANTALIALSAIVLTAVFAFALFFLTGRDRSFLLLGALCTAAAALLIAESWRQLFGYTYDWHIVRLRCVLTFAWLTGVLLVALLVTRFPHRHGRLVLATTALAALASIPFGHGWDQKSLYVFVITVSVTVVWTIFAAVRRLRGSALALFGVGVAGVALAIAPYAFVDNIAYFAFDFLFLCLLCSHALEVRRAQREKVRLELEMLRRHMQPHFLMNTLTALAEWIEQDPKTAVRMIESLSDEVRILSDMSTQRTVTAADELRLCRSHLANMSLRKDVAYELEVDGVDGARSIPPAIFHTLVENAITHGSADGGRVTLRLSSTNGGDRVRYVFEAPAGDDEESPAGTGTRYIEARLREAWGEAWSFRQGRVGAMWRAVIEVPLEQARGAS